MKIIVTGGTGFLGSHIVKSLVNEGHEVLVLKRSFSDTRRILSIISSIKLYDIDKIDLNQIFYENPYVDAVIHTATTYGRNNENFNDIFQTNTVFPLQLLEVASNYKVKTFINADTSLDKNVNFYSLSKKQFVDWGKKVALTNGSICFVNIVMEHFYGQGDEQSKFTTYIIKSCINNIPELKLTLGEQKRDFIYIQDVVDAFLILLKNIGRFDYFENYELGSGKALTIRSFVELVHSMTDSRTKLLFGAIPYRENELMESKANTEKLLDLGWSVKMGLEAGIKATLSEEIKGRKDN